MSEYLFNIKRQQWKLQVTLERSEIEALLFLAQSKKKILKRQKREIQIKTVTLLNR